MRSLGQEFLDKELLVSLTNDFSPSKCSNNLNLTRGSIVQLSSLMPFVTYIHVRYKRLVCMLMKVMPASASPLRLCFHGMTRDIVGLNEVSYKDRAAISQLMTGVIIYCKV